MMHDVMLHLFSSEASESGFRGQGTTGTGHA